MTPFYLLLGRTTELSFAELQALVGTSNCQLLSKHIAQFQAESLEEATAIFQLLGGSIKLLSPEGEFHDLTEEQLLEYATAFLAQFPKPDFAIAEFGRENTPAIALTDIKKTLRNRGIASRFIEADRQGLSASVLLHHKVIELNIIQNEGTTYFAKTLSVQNIDDWTKRDRGKPYADRKKGLLPPKVARMMVNIGLGMLKLGEPTSEATNKATFLYDPFCGSGTVLFEGLFRGCEVVGSDLDKNSVEGAEINLKWYQQAYGVQPKARVFQADATSVKPLQLERKVELLVTEPFLGKPTPKPEELPNVFKGLEKLYYGAFRNWTALLADSAQIVIVMPYAESGRHTHSLEKIIDKIQALGYTAELKPIVYHRPQAVIHRQIWVLKYQRPSSTQK